MECGVASGWEINPWFKSLISGVSGDSGSQAPGENSEGASAAAVEVSGLYFS